MTSGLDVVAIHRQGTFEFKEFGPRDGKHTYQELKSAGVTHWVSVGNPSDGAADMTLLKEFSGGVRLYQLPRWSDDERVSSNVPVNVQAWDREHIVLQGPDSGFDVVIRARWHPRWNASAGAVITRDVMLPGSRPNFMRILAPAGQSSVTLTFGPPANAARGYAFTMIALVLAALIVVRLPRLSLSACFSARMASCWVDPQGGRR